jgi:hypothetical protein
LHPESRPKHVAIWKQKQATLVEEIEQFEHELTKAKEQIKQIPKHIDWRELPDGEKFERLAPSRKKLLDTAKLIAY